MHLHTTRDPLPQRLRGGVLALGSFDGFHLGHQNVVGFAAQLADQMQTSLGVFVTEPHPRMVFRPETEPFLLTPLATKARLMQNFGVDHMCALPFNRQIASMPAQDFVLDILIKQLGAIHLVFGYDYRFGKGRGGGADMLAWMGHYEGFGTSQLEPIGVGVEGNAGEIYSSTLVRQAIREGLVRRAASLLGHWWSIEGQVQMGDQRGRLIGFPTANMDIEEYIKPRFGVYAVRVRLPETGETFVGVANVGKRPTFEKDDIKLEVHLFDFDRDIYEQTLQVDFVSFIRGEQKFDGIDSLKAQIATDCDTAKLALANPDNAADRFPTPNRDDYSNPSQQ
ncbi:MAG: bifunctional riboflavin kinase/FAD synthetase [Pseudomonadota bacterium]